MKTSYLLIGVVVAAAGIGFFVNGNRSAPAPEAAALDVVGESPTKPNDDVTSISGTVVESMDVPQYTYLRLNTAQGEVWAAVSTTEVKKQSHVTVTRAVRMENFESKALKRSFDVIYFGNLGNAADERQAASPPAAADLPDEQAGDLPPGHPAIGNGASDQQLVLPPDHPTAQPADAPVSGVTKAAGENGVRIAELYASLDKLRGKTLRVRGVVVKATPGIQGFTYLHLQDGSGSADKQDNDLTATTRSVPQKGTTITLEGKLATNVDVGAGYKYRALLQDCRAIIE